MDHFSRRRLGTIKTPSKKLTGAHLVTSILMGHTDTA